MNLSTETDYAQALELLIQQAVAAQGIANVAGTSMVMVPPGYKMENLTPWLDANRETPRRKEANVSLTDQQSFVQYWHNHHTEASVCFADPDNFTFRAILDYHSKSSEGPAGWRKHFATFGMKKSVEWNTWMGRATEQRKMTQEIFAEFLEDNAPDIIKPASADMIDLAKDLELHKDVVYTGKTRNNKGTELRFQETVSGKTSDGRIAEIPEQFTVRICPFVGSAPEELVMKLRFRLTNDGKAHFFYDPLRAHKVLEAAFTTTETWIKNELGCEILRGAAA